jgi:hypothetical protein
MFTIPSVSQCIYQGCPICDHSKANATAKKKHIQSHTTTKKIRESKCQAQDYRTEHIFTTIQIETYAENMDLNFHS